MISASELNRIESIPQLEAMFDDVDFRDKVEPMLWLKRMFELCAAARQPVPNIVAVGGRIGEEYELLPNFELSTFPPIMRSQRPTWALIMSLNALARQPPQCYDYYGITAVLLDAVLKDMPPTV